MKKVMIIGCCGAGKSTFAKKLQQKTGLPLFHLDQYYWKPNWVESSKEEWTATVQQLIQKEEWIMDGNYGGTMDQRIAAADSIIFLHYPTWLCFWRVLKRIYTYYGEVRPDMHEACRERLKLSFLSYVLHFNRIKSPKILQKLNQVKAHKSIFIASSDQELDVFLQNLKKDYL